MKKRLHFLFVAAALICGSNVMSGQTISPSAQDASTTDVSAAVAPAVSVDLWPDGTPISEWFSATYDNSASRRPRKHFKITSYGARRDSTLVQTKAIQKAIDAASRAGGGVIVVPKGTFLSGALFFAPGTSLHLEEGAVLKGSRDLNDYPDAPVHIEGVVQPYVSALVNAYNVDGFSITGPGTIYGDGMPWWQAFRQRQKENPQCTNLEVRRPRLVYVAGSNDVTIDNVTLKDSGFWTLHLYKCNRVKILFSNISAPMRKPMRAPSTDGVDIDACNDVYIKDCFITSGDDIIAIKGGKGPFADQDPANGTNSHILVEDCHFGMGPAVITAGSECMGLDNVIVRSSKVDDTDRLLWLKMRPDTHQKYTNILVDNIEGKVGTVLYIRPWTQFYDPQGQTIPVSHAENITVSNCTLRCKRERNVGQDTTQYILKNIALTRNKLKISWSKDEKKVPKYTLEDPLTFADGSKVASEQDWSRRRDEILEIFQHEMYGRLPAACPVYAELLEEGPSLSGLARRRQLRMWFTPEHTGPYIDWLMMLPAKAKAPVPAIITLNYYGNHTIVADKEVLIPDCWLDDSEEYGVVSNRATEAGRGVFCDNTHRTVYPLNDIIEQGYAFVTACYGQISPDPGSPDLQTEMAISGIFDLWGPRDESKGDNTMALMAWGWALMRGMDMLEADAGIDASKVVVTGSSRLGKAALVAAAFDQRFAVAVINQTGGGGVPLTKRVFGENVASEVAKFRHWFCENYARYACNEKKMKFDQHLLLSCIAPRPLLIEGFDNPWFDAKGEFLSLKAASPVWEFFGRPGLPEVSFPDDYSEDAIGPVLGYVRRDKAHGIAPVDWKWMLEFSNKIFGK